MSNDAKNQDPKLKELIEKYNKASKIYFAHHNSFISQYRELAEYHDNLNRKRLQMAVDSGAIPSELAKDLLDKEVRVWMDQEKVTKLQALGVRLHSKNTNRSFVKNSPQQSMVFFEDGESDVIETHSLFQWRHRERISFNDQDAYFFQPPQMLVGNHMAPLLLEGIDARSIGFNSIIKPPEGLQHEDVSEWIISKIKDPQFVTLYRVKTDRLLHNPWTPHLQDLNKVFHFTDGSTIDGRLPENIEVGFYKNEKSETDTSHWSNS